MPGNYSRLFGKYTDEQLLELASQRDTLLDAGKIALDEEMSRRGFDPSEQIKTIAEVTDESTGSTRSLKWFVPLVGVYAFIVVMMFSPHAMSSGAVIGLISLYCAVSPIGGFWMLYQSVRFESSPGKYVLLAFIPGAFLWYYFERVRRRTYLGRLPVSIRRAKLASDKS